MAYAELCADGPNGWRARYKKPDGTLGSQSGFSSEKAARKWGEDQEALIRRNLWIDPKDAETPFGSFAEGLLEAMAPRMAPGTVAKYRTIFAVHLIPQWGGWPLIGIFNSYVEIEKWVSELHEEYAEATVATIFSAFSWVLTGAVRERLIPASPCAGIRVTTGEYDTERLVATPVQVLRAAMNLYAAGLGLGGFVLCLVDAYSGGRWSELAGQQRHEYDRTYKAISIREPLKEVGGALAKGGRRILTLKEEAAVADEETTSVTDSPVCAPAPAQTTSRAGRPRRRGQAARAGRTKTPAGTRSVALPPSIAVFYELLLDSHDHAFVFSTPEGRPWRRSNFRQRWWRPAWDGRGHLGEDDHLPVVLPWFTFHEGRHTHATWMAADGIPEVARRARLGQKMKGIARVYDHVTEDMNQAILRGLEARWVAGLKSLPTTERDQLIGWFPHVKQTLIDAGDEAHTDGAAAGRNTAGSILAPSTH